MIDLIIDCLDSNSMYLVNVLLQTEIADKISTVYFLSLSSFYCKCTDMTKI